MAAFPASVVSRVVLVLGLTVPRAAVAQGTPQPLCQTGCSVFAVSVTPDGSSVTHPVNTNGWDDLEFIVKNTGTNGDTYTLSCSATGGITCVSVTPGSVTLASGASSAPSVVYNVGASGGTVTLTAMGHASDQGWYTVNVVVNGPPVVALRNQNGDNLDRSMRLTSGAGEAAAWECGDLVVTHGLPGYATMGRQRTLTLLYNSAQAVPKPVVAAAVNEGAVAQPTTVFVRLSLNGLPRDSATYTGWLATPTRQVAIAHDATNDSTGVYPFTLLVRNQYPGGTYDATVSGNLIVVNRSQSEFGAGWSLVGVERLKLAQPNNAILWIGGDASAKLYDSVAAATWRAAAGAYRDTLVRFDSASATWYRRTLRHRIQVTFDATGRHVRTTNRVGQSSFFYWNPTSGRLDSIAVPPAGQPGTVYRIAYDTNGKLDSIIDPANRVLNATVAGNRLTQLVDPDTTAYHTDFAYDAVGRMTGRTTRRNYTTTFVYTKALRVDTVKVPLDPARGDTAKVSFQPWDERGLSAGNGSTGNVAVDTALAYTKIDGPRTDVADTAEFWIDRWGAPVRLRDPLGNQTYLTRGDVANPALVTRVLSPDGRILGAVYNARGNLASLTDSTYQGTGSTQAVTTAYVYGELKVPDSPTEVRAPVDTTKVSYDTSLGLPTLFTAQGGHRTAFQYFTTGVKRGLLSSVTDSAVSVVDTTLWTKSTQHLVTQFLYDAWGNDSVIISPKNAKTEILRDGYRRPQYVRDPVRHRTDYGYDRLNRIGTMTVYDDTLLNGPKATHYYYNRTGAMDSVVDQRSVKRSWTYDAADRAKTMMDDVGVVESRHFNRGGLLDTLTTRLGHVIAHTYDAAGRLTKTTYPANTYVQGTSIAGDTVVRTYDAVGRMLTAENRNGVDTLQYNLEGTVRLERQVARDDNKAVLLDLTTRTWYDSGARRVTFFDGTDTLYYGYGSDALLSKLKVAWKVGSFPPDSFLFTWDGLGRRDRVVYGTIRDTVSFGYDKDGALRMVCSRHPGGVSGSFDVLERRVRYTALDADGLVRAMDHWAGANEGSGCNSATGTVVETISSAAHDGRHQLLSTQSSRYHYDASGNMTYDSLTAAVDSFTTVAGSNRLSTSTHNGSGLTYGYDPNGNRIRDYPPGGGDGLRTRFFNAVGQLFGDSAKVGIDWVGNPSMFRYDALGRRVKARTSMNTFFNLTHDGDNTLRATGFMDWRYVHGPGLDDPLVAVFQYAGCVGSYCRVYYLTDGRGRLLAFTDSAGNDQMADLGVPSLAQLYSVKGGSLAGAIDKSNTFANSRAESQDAPQLSFYRNRYYDQQSGRFVQEDPIGIAGGGNLYAYAGNSPATFTDPFGLCADDGNDDGADDASDQGADDGSDQVGTDSTKAKPKPKKLKCNYQISTGEMKCKEPGGQRNVVDTRGYSGAPGRCMNNPAMTGKKNCGPLPANSYEMTPLGNYKNFGPNTILLTPLGSTNMFGRSGFLLHGENPKHLGASSSGCGILDQGTLSTITAHGGGTLTVTP